MDPMALRLKELGYDRGGRGLPVTPSHTDDGTGTDRKEHLHLAGQYAPPFHGGGELRQVRSHPRRAEDHVFRQSLQIIRSQPQQLEKNTENHAVGKKGKEEFYFTRWMAERIDCKGDCMLAEFVKKLNEQI